MRQLGKQQPTAPGGLGFKTLGREDTAALETGRAVMQTMQEQAVALAEAKAAVEVAGMNLVQMRRDAVRLWRALQTTAEALRDLQVEDDDLALTEDVEAALRVLQEVDYSGIDDPDPCPECRAGKHGNCTGEVLADDDTMQPCPCQEAGH